jgi:hypothetical protein
MIPFFRELRGFAERHLGALEDQRQSFGATGVIEALRRNSCFHNIRSQTKGALPDRQARSIAQQAVWTCAASLMVAEITLVWKGP